MVSARLHRCVVGVQHGLQQTKRSGPGADCGAKLRSQDYCLNTSGGPLTRLPLRSTITSTRSAIFTNGMPLFIP